MKTLRRAVLEYLQENLGVHILVGAFFLTGILAGSSLVKFITESHLSELHAALSCFLEKISDEASGVFEPLPLLKASLQKNIGFLLAAWLLGFFSLGFPFTLFYLALKGLALGFTIGFLVGRSAFKGVVFSLAAILPHNFVLIPAYLAAAARSTLFSILRLKNRLGKGKVDLGPYFLQYCLFMFLVFLLMVLGGVVEAYITPVFMRLAHSLL